MEASVFQINSKVAFLLLLACSGAAAWDASDELESRCDSTCPDEDATRSCCREIGFATGYCKPYGRAECEGRSYGRTQNQRGYGGQMTRNNNRQGLNGGSRVPNGAAYNQPNGQGNAPLQGVGAQNPASASGRGSIRIFGCDSICGNGGNVNGCCVNNGFGSGICHGRSAYCKV